jgi:predicted Zn-ribbon and HTH transcriptional regulator
MNKLTAQQKKEYIDSKGSKCPFCKSIHIESDRLNADGSIATANCTCGACKAEWVDIYSLIDMETADE